MTFVYFSGFCVVVCAEGHHSTRGDKGLSMSSDGVLRAPDGAPPAVPAGTAATATALPADLSNKRKAIADALDKRESGAEKKEGVIGQVLLRPADAAGRSIHRRLQMNDYMSSVHCAFPALFATAAADGDEEDDIADTFFRSMFTDAYTHEDDVYAVLADGLRAVLTQGLAHQVIQSIKCSLKYVYFM